jgi:two-component system nitrogen regulation response regulator GlnG
VLSDEAADLLSLHSWPGNVRELQNLMQRMTVLTRDSVISAEHVRPVLALSEEDERRGSNARAALAEAATLWARERLVIGAAQKLDDLHDQLLDVVEPALITEALATVDGNQIRAAAILGMNRNTLRKKLNIYDIDPTQPRQRG